MTTRQTLETRNPFAAAFGGIGASPSALTRSEFAARTFLNPRVPRAVQNDPDGSYHFGLQVTDEDGNPIANLRKDQPIGLALRWYQKDMIDDTSRFRVYRCGRRIGKSFVLGAEAVIEALQNPNAKILVLAPNESHIKILFDEYIRPLLRTYRHRKSGRIGIPRELGGNVPKDCDFIITRDTQKPQEIVITDGKNHNVTIRGMVISNAARGQSASLLIFDEADYADTSEVQGIVAPIIATMPSTRIVMSSTPTGRRDSFYYEACHDKTWSQHHHTFAVLPHYDEELHAMMAKLSGGETSNTFLQEYLAEFGNQTEGVFDQKALNKAFFVGPYVQVLERIDRRTRERHPTLAAARTESKDKTEAYFEAIKPVDFGLTRSPIGSESIYRPEYVGNGIVTVGTDWNEVAGMQTVMVWWPPQEWLEQGKIRVARFQYKGTEPVVTSRAKNRQGAPEEFIVGHDNGNPGGVHDLSHIKGIVIWHGRLESGYFNWQAAANRVIGLMSIPHFIDAWYVDYGYGAQVNKMIEGIMESGQYIPDGESGLVPKARDIEPPLLNQIRLFHPEKDPEQTGKIYRTVRFGDVYPSRNIDFGKRDDRYKDIMVSLTKRMVSGREILLPFGELVGYYGQEELGNHYEEEINSTTGDVKEIAKEETDADNIEPTGGDQARGDRSFGGLVTQMREWRVDGISPTGRPRYSGADHAIDALMLALLAYEENYSEEGAGNIFRKNATLETDIAEDLLSTTEFVNRSQNEKQLQAQTDRTGHLVHKNYKSERAPLDAIVQGKRSARDVGTGLNEMLKMAARQLNRRT